MVAKGRPVPWGGKDDGTSFWFMVGTVAVVVLIAATLNLFGCY